MKNTAAAMVMDEGEHYARQILIDQIGTRGQEKLARSSVMVVGAGGLGSPALTYLVAAGVGRVGLVDSGNVSLSNLNRQFLHNVNDIGRPKAESAREKLVKLNDNIEINALGARLTGHNAKEILSGYDLVLGAVDSLETRFVINRACVSLRVPYIDGGVNGFSGCVMFLHPPGSPCLNCVYSGMNSKKETVGVLGATAGVIGAIEANIALLWLLGLPNPLKKRFLLYDGLALGFESVEIRRDTECPVCGGI
jgi:adenylyltransferase/sulfurtransferase